MPGEQIHDPLHSTNGNGNGHLTMDRIMESSRLVELEEKTKQQDLEIHLLKCTLADTLNRINALEKNGKKASTNGRRKSAHVDPIAETKPTNVSKRHSVPARRPTSSLRHSQTSPEQQKTNKKHAETPQNVGKMVAVVAESVSMFYREVFGKMEELRQSKILCDIQLCVGKKQINAHKLLLASAVPYFCSMFSHQVLETQQWQITLNDMDPSSVESIVNFLYTAEIVIDNDNVEKLLQTSSILQMKLIEERCCDFLQQQLDASNALGIYAFSEMHGCRKLKETAKSFCERHFCDVTEEEEFLTLPLERVKWLLAQEELCVRSETEVFNAALRWISYDLMQRKDTIQQILPIIRLHLIPRAFLSTQMTSNALIKTDEISLSVLQNVIKDIELKRLPAVSKRVWSRNLVVYLFGGYNRRSSKQCSYFHPEEERWHSVGEMRTPKSGAGCCSVGGFVYMVGGRTNSASGYVDSNMAEVFDPYTQKWKQIAPMHASRHRLGVAAIEDTLYAVGGSEGMIHLNSVERYNPNTDAWSRVPSLNTPRIGVGAAVLEGRLYAVGGFDSENRLSTVEVYEEGAEEWVYTKPMNTPRSGAGVCAMNGHVYAVGGYNGVAQLNSVERYCPQQNTWTMLSSMNLHRSALSVAVVKNKLYVFGGYNGERFLDSCETYDPDSGEWQMLPPMPDPRSGAGVAVSTAPIT